LSCLRRLVNPCDVSFGICLTAVRVLPLRALRPTCRASFSSY
jgi:hypothetical protein